MGDEKEIRATGQDEMTGAKDDAGSGQHESVVDPGKATAPHGEEATDSARRSEKHGRDHAGRKHGKKGVKEALERAEEKAADLTAENEVLRTEVKELKDKWLRSVAEYENYRKRTRREWELQEQRTKADVILDVLAVVDDFERAFSVAGERDDDFIRGIRLIYNNLLSSLEKIGVRKIEALDAAFDPAYHMAVAQIERDGADSNHVIEIVQEGYCLGDFLVRPAKVVISK
jgi:molecular chaperone GrpE